MRLKMRDEQNFNICLDLNVDWEQEDIDITVTVWDKRHHTRWTNTFGPDCLATALAYYRQQETFLLGTGKQTGEQV